MSMKSMKNTCYLMFLGLMVSSSAVQALDFATYNIRNFDADPRSQVRTNKPALKDILLSLNAELMAVEEIVNVPEFENFVAQNLPEYTFKLTDCGGAGKQRLGFLYKRDKLVLQKFIEEDRVANGGACGKGLRPAAIGHFYDNEKKIEFTAVAVHLKAGGRQANADVRFRQYQIIGTLIKELRTQGHERVVVMGDFNTTDYVLRNQNYARFISFLDQNHLVDFSPEINCTAYWWGGVDDGIEYSSILDHVILTQEMFDSFKSHTVKVHAHCQKAQCGNVSSDELGVSYNEVSDHCPLALSLE